MKPRLLITGASGYLGRRLARRAATTGFEVIAAYGRQWAKVTAGRPLALDVTDAQAVRRAVASHRPQVIVHCAAANPGRPEAEMMAVNAEGSRHVAEAATAAGARLIHLSTDVVFDGRHPPYDEDAPLSPVNPYGRSKAAAETAVLETAPGATVVRTSLIYDLDEVDRSNAGFIDRLRSGQPLVLWTDVIRQPVWAATLVSALLELAGGHPPPSGILNIAGGQALNRWEFGRRMLAYWGAEGAENLQAGLAAAEPFPVPLDLRLDLGRAQSLLATPLLGVDEVLGQKG
ncbi:MAG: SDR family oxidoreductase [Anaerolineae bacterium]